MVLGRHRAPPHHGPMTRDPDRLVTGRFLLVCVSTFAFFMAVGINLPVLPRFIKGPLGGSDLAVGITVTSLSIAAIFARPLLGRVGRRHGQRRLMIGGATLAAGAFALCATVHALVPLIVLRVFAGFGDAALFVGAATIISELSPSNRRAEGAAYLSVAVFIGLGVGPFVGDSLQRGGHFALAFLIAAACDAIAAVLALLVQQPAGLVSSSRAKLRILHPAGLRTGAVLALVMTGFAGWSTFVALRADQLHVGAGTFFAIYSFTVLVLRVTCARLPERIGLGRVAFVAIGLCGVGLLLMGIVNGVEGMVIGTIVMSFGIAFYYPSLMAITLNSVVDGDRAAVVPTFTMFFEVGSVAGGLALGPVANFFGYRAVFVTGGLLALADLALLWVVVLVPRQNALRRAVPRVIG